jgi:hypothetical protein
MKKKTIRKKKTIVQTLHTQEVIPPSRALQVQAKSMETKGTEIMQVNDPESIIRYALDKGNLNVDTMERLLVMRKELQQEYAKKQFDEALANFQTECPHITKTKSVMNRDGKTVRYNYAPIDEIDKQIKPFLFKYGFSYSFDTTAKPDWLRVVFKLTHVAGHSELHVFEGPVNKDANMNNMQHYAEARTFYCRYALIGGLGLVTADEDTDTNSEKVKPAGPSKLKVDDESLKPYASQLWNILIPVRGLAKNWELANKWLREMEFINDTEELPYTLTVERYKEVIDKSSEFLKTNPLGVKQ